VDVATDLLSGLEALHSARLVHTDLSFENVLLRWEDVRGEAPPRLRASIIDFNALKDWGEVFEDGMLRARAEKGRTYGAREARITGAVDLYAAGYILKAVLAKYFSREVRSSDPDLAGVSAVFERMMNADPSRRETATSAKGKLCMMANSFFSACL